MQGRIQRLISPQQAIVDTRSLRLRPQRLKVPADSQPIFAFNIIRRHLQRYPCLHVLKEHWLVQLRPNLIGVQDVEQNHFIAADSQQRCSRDNSLRLVPEIGNYHHDSAPVRQFEKMH